MKFAIIRKVPFKLPGKKSRVVWGNVLCEHEGMALVLIPRTEADTPHSLFIATENFAERVFEAVVPIRFDLEMMDVMEAGEKLRVLGKTFKDAEFQRRFRLDDYD